MNKNMLFIIELSMELDFVYPVFFSIGHNQFHKFFTIFFNGFFARAGLACQENIAASGLDKVICKLQFMVCKRHVFPLTILVLWCALINN